MLKKGDVFTNNIHNFTVIEKDKQSYILESSTGVRYKATEKSVKSKLKQIAYGTEDFQKEPYPFLKRRIELSKIFKENETMPTNATECEKWFSRLECELSPENLSCDGELTRAEVLAKHKEIIGTWKELEKISGKKREPVY